MTEPQPPTTFKMLSYSQMITMYLDKVHKEGITIEGLLSFISQIEEQVFSFMWYQYSPVCKEIHPNLIAEYDKLLLELEEKLEEEQNAQDD